MAERLTEEISVSFNSRYRNAYALLPPANNGLVPFGFEFFKKGVQHGDACFEQRWMPIGSVYGQRNCHSALSAALADCFWASCLEDGKVAEQSNAQTIYFLAKLLPFVRSNGGRRVFADATPSREDSREFAGLNELLDAGKNNAIDRTTFHRRTRDQLGPPDYDSDSWRAYFGITTDLFADALGHLLFDPDDAWRIVRANWQQLMRQVGRRRGKPLEKTILDMLSYECRAAIHRCYSHVWLQLLKRWDAQRELTPESLAFHRLWHLELMEPDGFSAFHGHIIGLHPAAADFICTATGSALLGEFVTSTPGTPGHIEALGRVLNGVALATYWYSQRRDETASRRRQPRLISGPQLDDSRPQAGRRKAR